MVSPAPPGSSPAPAAPTAPGVGPAPRPGGPGAPPGPLPPAGGGGAVVVVAACVSVVVVVGILAAIAIPSFIKYKRRAAAAEATFSLSRIVYGATAYWDGIREDDSEGELVATGQRRFPASVDWTPRHPPCERGAPRYEPDEKEWEQPTWQTLGFAMTNPHRYRYRFTSTGKGATATFTVEAEGDLNCNGVRSNYRRVGHIVDGKVVVEPLVSKNPLD